MWGARQIAVTAALLGAAGVAWFGTTKAGSMLDDTPAAAPPSMTEAPIGPAARRAAEGEMELPGRPMTHVPPQFDFTRPTVVARAYLVAAHSLAPRDEGRTNRRVLPYLAKTNPDYPRGIVVVDAPGPGRVATAVVDRLTLMTRNKNRDAVAYKAWWTVSIGPVGSSATRVETRTGFLVLHRQPDGRWLIAQDTPHLQPAGD